MTLKIAETQADPISFFLPPLCLITRPALSNARSRIFYFFEFNCFYMVKKIKKSCPFARPQAKAELLTHISTLLFNFLFALKKISKKKFAPQQQQRANLQSLSFISSITRAALSTLSQAHFIFTHKATCKAIKNKKSLPFPTHQAKAELFKMISSAYQTNY